MSLAEIPVTPQQLRQHLNNMSATTLRDQMKAKKIPPFDVVISQKTRYWHRRTLERAGILKAVTAAEKPVQKPLSEEMRNALYITSLCLQATDIKARPGVYLLVNDTGVPVYIGQSSNVTLRISRHYDKQFSIVKMIEIGDKEKRLQVEAEMIRFFNPEFNLVLLSKEHRSQREQDGLG